MSGRVFATNRELEKVSETRDAIIVSYSTGKDSMVLLDLCAKHFKRVVALHMYFVRGLSYIEQGLDYARIRWGCEVIQLPHWATIKVMKDNHFCNYADAAGLPDASLIDIYRAAMAQTGIDLVATGARKTDGLWRRRWLRSISDSQNYKNVIFPINEWVTVDVMSYIKANKIPMPQLSKDAKSGVSGIGSDSRSMLWLHDRHPEDFKLVERVFPYARAVVARREFYGIGAKFAS